ncbi:site-2 protease family protein [Ralstonia soli]|uniref:Site-2 protease family protein n=1 Tax=Ralstonia soli TaxID=2953896 RepID=A0ABT1AI67_9RALS|nr:site-2 protease family protein [Ralstonia soli]MCO5398107.1 site-2 protease family protein [Ralstonia soli]
MDPTLIQNIAVYAIPVLFAITLHEAAHGYVAKHFGDDTAYAMGRVSINPLRHIDPIGTIAMPLLLYFATKGAFVFGYAKPVPVRFGRLRDPRWHGMWVALAGPATNFVQAIFWGVLAILLVVGGVNEPFLNGMARAGILVNMVMAAFNMFPLPPLDGGRVLAALLPPRAALGLSRIEPFGFFIVMALIISNVITNVWMRPIMALLLQLLQWILSPLLMLFS